MPDKNTPGESAYRWEVLESVYLLRRPWMNLRVDRVVLPTGTELDEFHVVEYPDWALVIPVTEDDRFVMVRQYRHGIGRVCLEFPAGAIGGEEEPLGGAQRELLEETGFGGGKWRHLACLAPEPSKQTNHAHLFLAEGVVSVAAARLDSSEDLAVHILDREQVGRAIASGEMRHAVHVTAFLMAFGSGPE
jgi:8-oxo-dGTP pyrophosphatase MutT (NUDIX family)